jgi:hypothetical protein
MSRPRRRQRSSPATKEELVFSPLVAFFERKKEPAAKLAQPQQGLTPLIIFFQELLVRQDTGQPLDTWILIADKALTPHKTLIRELGSKSKQNKNRRLKFRKSASTSQIECCDDDSDLIPAQLLTDRRKDHSKDRWKPQGSSAPVIVTRKRRASGVVQKKTYGKLEEESPRSVIITPWNALAVPRDFSPSMLKPQRRPSKQEDLQPAPPPPPLYLDGGGGCKSSSTTEKQYTATVPLRRSPNKQFLRSESDSSLICPKRTGRTLQASRLCYSVLWVQTDVKQHNHVLRVRLASSSSSLNSSFSA